MTDRGAFTLMTAVRPAVVVGTLARLLATLAVLLLVPLTATALLDEAGPDWRLAGLSAGLLGLCLPLVRAYRGPGTSADIQWNEALAITALTFALAPLLLVYPMTGPITGANVPFLDAWFEAVSGVTTTGLTTLRNLEERPDGFLLLRAWVQWFGGLGIAVLSVAFMMRHHASGKRLLETSGESFSRDSARAHAQRVFLAYSLLTLIAIIATWVSGPDLPEAIAHGLAAVSTGGFATSDHNIAPLSGATVAILSLMALLGAISLPLYSQIWRRGRGNWSREPELRALLVAVLLVGALLTLLARQTTGLGWADALAQGFTLGISAQTDTGFSTQEIATLDPASKLVLIVSMTIGGCTGSTAGGLKLVRLLILLRLVQLALRRTAVPERAVLRVQLGGSPIEPEVIAGTLQLMGLWLMVVLCSWMLFLLHGYAPMDALFEVTSAIATAGLSTGITRPELEPLLKLVLMANMLFGRVEILAMLVLLYPPTWIGRRRPPP